MPIIFEDFFQNMEKCCSCLVIFVIHKQRAFLVAWFTDMVTGAGNILVLKIILNLLTWRILFHILPGG